MKKRSIALLVAAVSLATAGVVHADASKTGGKVKMYKWVDKNGVTQYGSSVPPEYAAQQSQGLNSQGQVVQTVSAQKTPEQVAAEAQAQQQAQAQAKADAVTKAHDKVLLDTYTSVADMERDRDSKVSAIEAQITVLNGNIGSVENTLADYQGRAKELTSKDKPVPANLQKQMDATNQQLIENQQQLLQQEQYKKQLQDQFSKDIERYKELTHQVPMPAPAAATH